MENISSWSWLHFLSPCLLQELSKIAMPVIFNEPLSFLQRLTEYMEHVYLIHQANMSSDSVDRMKVMCSGTSWSLNALWIIAQNSATCNEMRMLQRLIGSVFSSAVGSVWLRLQCLLWPRSGRGQVNPSTPCWERPMSWSGKRDYNSGDKYRKWPK